MFQYYECSQHCQASSAGVGFAFVSDLLKLILHYSYFLIPTSPVDSELTQGRILSPPFYHQDPDGTKAWNE